MQLPTVRQLAGFLRIDPNTVARALADLERDGYVEGQQGRGTFVADRSLDRGGIELLRDHLNEPDRWQSDGGTAHGG
jgi:DNA-binding transcriptional regulator YhcF (GntR family)